MTRANLRKFTLLTVAALTQVGFVQSSTVAFAATRDSTHAKYTLEQVQINDAGQFLIVVAPHGDMDKVPIDPHFTNHKKEFEVEFNNVSLGVATINETNTKLRLNQRISVSGSPYATDMEWKKSGHRLDLTLWLKPGIRSFESLMGGGFMVGYRFGK